MHGSKPHISLTRIARIVKGDRKGDRKADRHPDRQAGQDAIPARHGSKGDHRSPIGGRARARLSAVRNSAASSAGCRAVPPPVAQHEHLPPGLSGSPGGWVHNHLASWPVSRPQSIYLPAWINKQLQRPARGGRSPPGRARRRGGPLRNSLLAASITTASNDCHTASSSVCKRRSSASSTGTAS